MSGITLEVDAAKTKEQSSARGYGTQVHEITDKEKQTFGIEPGAVEKAIEKMFHTDADVVGYGATEAEKAYLKMMGRSPVSSTLVVDKAEIIGIETKPLMVMETVLDNATSDTEATFDAGIHNEETNTVSHTWSKSDSITVSQSIQYGIKFLGTGGGGSTTLSYTHDWGSSKTETKDVTVGSSASVSVVLKPHQKKVAELWASKGTLKVRFTFKATLAGTILAGLKDSKDPKNFHAVDVNAVLSELGESLARTVTEDLEVGYYCNGQVKLTDAKDENLVFVLPQGFGTLEPLRLD